MHLSRFAMRLAVALLVMASVLAIHARHHTQLLLLAGCAALLIWASIEIGHGYVRRHRVSKSAGAPRPRR